MRDWYQRQSEEKRRAIVAARNPERVRANARATYERNREARLDQMAAYRATDRGREVRNQRNAEWAKRNPEKRRVYKIVQRALKKGTLVRPETCSVKGCERKPHAHHEDYDKPFEIEWLCPRHHSARHRGIDF